MKTYELKPRTNTKSFYGKAIVIETDTEWTLLSYGVQVAMVSKSTGEASTTGYHSATTTRHQIEFLSQFSDAIVTTKHDIIKLEKVS